MPTVSLAFDIFSDHTCVTSEFSLERQPWTLSDDVVLDGDASVSLQDVFVNGTKLDGAAGDYTVIEDGAKLVIRNAAVFGSGAGADTASVKIVTSIQPHNNTQLSGL